jgi:uncharacterized membrane protein YgcG
MFQSSRKPPGPERQRLEHGSHCRHARAAGTYTWMASFSVEHTFDIVNVSRMIVCPRLLLSSILCADKITARYNSVLSMHKLAFPAPAPPALGSAAEPSARARACAVCREPLHGGRALRCAQCACGPFHPGCALPISGSQPRCPRCAQLVAARGAGAAAARVVGPRERVDLTGVHGAGGVGAGAAGGGGGRGGGGARGRCGHGKQRGKCRECRELRADGSLAVWAPHAIAGQGTCQSFCQICQRFAN